MTAIKNYRIVLADDHELFLSGLKGLLSRQSGCDVVGTAHNGAECIALLRDVECDVVMMDVDMPVMDGIKATEQISQIYPDVKVVVLSMHGDDEYYFRMVEAGAKGFILKNSSIDEVVAAVKTVAQGGNYFSQELLCNLVGSLKQSRVEQPEKVLSEREREILLLICKGLSNQEIADVLFISKRTVDKHRANILEKTECKNTANLVVWAIKNSIAEI